MAWSLLKLIGLQKIPARPADQTIRGRADAARTTADLVRAFANADGLSADATCSPADRAILRNRGRHEQLNNPYTDGMLSTYAADIIGKAGPRLKMLSGDTKLDSLIENEFATWMVHAGIAEKLRIMIETRAAAGECFGLMTTNPALPTPVKANLRLIEGDQVATPSLLPAMSDPLYCDGIVFDRFGNPVEYHVLRRHPGDNRYMTFDPLEYDRIPADDMIHLFKQRRPGQSRGLPQIASSLLVFQERRGFRKSVLSAARKCAEMGAVMVQSEAGADPGGPGCEAFETLDIESGMMTTLPAGYKAQQMEPVQPSTTYQEFDDKLINEAARPLHMPFNIAACNSKDYNYSSGRLDHQTYFLMNQVEQGEVEIVAMYRLLKRWLTEAVLIAGYLPLAARKLLNRPIPHKWLWRGREHVDPRVEAEAQKVRLEARTTTLSDELAAEGTDFETHVATLENEENVLANHGIRNSKPLAGPQIDAGMNVLERLLAGRIPQVAAIEFLIALEFSQEQARKMVFVTAAMTPPATPAPATAPAPADPVPPAPTAAAPHKGLNGHNRLVERGLV